MINVIIDIVGYMSIWSVVVIL